METVADPKKPVCVSHLGQLFLEALDLPLLTVELPGVLCDVPGVLPREGLPHLLLRVTWENRLLLLEGRGGATSHIQAL